VGAPAVISGHHVYIVWFTNEGTVNSNYEVGFRASNDSGATFGPIMNLSNTANSDSINAEIAAEGKNVIVSWWEKNQTAMVPVAKVSTDYGHTFGPRLNITIPILVNHCTKTSDSIITANNYNVKSGQVLCSLV
jgi:hypothetical protein